MNDVRFYFNQMGDGKDQIFELVLEVSEVVAAQIDKEYGLGDF